MNKFRYLSKEKTAEIPKTPGVYAFMDAKKIWYIGKATDLQVRARSHFRQLAYPDHFFINKTTHVGYIETDSEIEALLLESLLIKKHKPKYNIMLRDDKQYFYVGFSREKLPRILTTHQPKLTGSPNHSQSSGTGQADSVSFAGPFTDGKSLKTVLRYLRKAFPYYTKAHGRLPCSYCHLDLCPGPPPKETLGPLRRDESEASEPRSSSMSRNPFIKEYKKDISKIKAVLRGQKPRVITSLKKEMAQFAKGQNFEKAAKIRDQIMALENIFAHRSGGESSVLLSGGFEGCFGMVPRRGQNSPSLGASRWAGENDARKQIAKTRPLFDKLESIEAYDISNIQGKEPVASMVRFADFAQISDLATKSSTRRSSPERGRASDWRPDKNLYRRFKIRLPEKPNDVAMIKEVVRRRLAHTEWPYPELMLIDGGRGQLNAALSQIRSWASEGKGTKGKSLTLTKEKLNFEEFAPKEFARPAVVALAKRFNELYVPNRKEPIPLDTLPIETKHLLMFARDEAHRFAISYHRKLHRKQSML